MLCQHALNCHTSLTKMQINRRKKRILRAVPGKCDCSNHCLHFPISHCADYVCQLHWPNNFHKKKKKAQHLQMNNTDYCHFFVIAQQGNDHLNVWSQCKHWWGRKWKPSIKNDCNSVPPRSCGLCSVGSNNPAAFMFALSYVSSFSWDCQKQDPFCCCAVLLQQELNAEELSWTFFFMFTEPTNDVQHLKKRQNKIQFNASLLQICFFW